MIDPLKQVKDALDKAIEQKKMTADFAKSIGPAVIDVLRPVLEEIASNSKLPVDEITKAISQIKVNVSDIKVPTPHITVPPIIVPKQDAPIVNYTPPDIKVNVPVIDIKGLAARIEIPKEMDVKGWISLMGYDRGLLSNPLPVQIRDANGKPVLFNAGGSIISGGGGGGGSVKVINASNEPVNVTIVGGSTATTGVNIQDSSGVGYSGSNPLPVTIASGGSATTAVQNVNADGTYRDTFPVQGSVSVSGITGSVGATILDGEGNMKTTWIVSDITNSVKCSLIDSGGVGYSGSNPIPVTITSGGTATSASNIVDSSGIAYSGSNPVPVVITSGASATTAVQNLDGDGNYRGTFPIQGTVAVSGITGSVGATILNGEGLARDSWQVSGFATSVGASLIDSSGIQYSGTNPMPINWVSGAGASQVVHISDSTGIAYNGSNPIPVRMVTGAYGTVGASNVDSSGIQYSGSNPMPVYLVSGAGNSTVCVGPVAEGVADDGSAPVKIGGTVRTTNPTAHSDGQSSSISLDKLGRVITKPVQVRDLVSTAYVAKATGSTFGTETALLAATAGFIYDLIYVMGTNDSTAAINCDIRGITAGNILLTLTIPPGGTAGLALPVPIPQTSVDSGNAWTIDLPDVTGTNVTVSGLFSKEV